MSLTSEERKQTLMAFLEAWPEWKLCELTLEKYIGVGDKNTFAYWLEFGEGRYLGSNAGGDASKFGIYERKAEPKGSRNFILQDDRYSWKKKYGNSAQEAFSVIKERMLAIVSAVGRKDLVEIQGMDFEPSLKWKLAFIYQDQADPCILPIYNLKRLRMLVPDGRKTSHAEAYSILMSDRGDVSALDYGITLWKQTGAKVDEPDEEDDSETEVEQSGTPQRVMPALNQILYGPPGTGKTYNTVNKALEILDPGFLAEHAEDDPSSRAAIKARFDQLVKEERIDFVTFHQSFSYEDFVEGIRAVVDEPAGMEQGARAELRYKIEDGIFKSACRKTPRNIPRVLIIDEINRGNISRIFGELITLIEPSKRQGGSDALMLTLPYSKTHFSVPDNLWIIGTMNTADRSLAGLDIALRRRFHFIEMQPDHRLLENVIVEDNGVEINIARLLQVMNQRIEVLLDREHCLGHAYFMPLKTAPSLDALSSIFLNQVIPLLQEYFFEDWEKIGWVLNGHTQDDSRLQLIRRPAVGESLTALFGSKLMQEHAVNDRRWLLNLPAFNIVESYRHIAGLA